MSPVDILFFLMLAGLIGLGAQRQLVGAALGAAALILFRVLLGLGAFSVILAWLVGLAVAAAIVFGGRFAFKRIKLGKVTTQILGALGGLIIGLLLMFATAVSLPLEYNIQGGIVYPPANMPMAQAVKDSKIIQLGRKIFLADLLIEQGIRNAAGELEIQPSDQDLFLALQRFFVLSKPWEDGG